MSTLTVLLLSLWQQLWLAYYRSAHVALCQLSERSVVEVRQLIVQNQQTPRNSTALVVAEFAGIQNKIGEEPDDNNKQLCKDLK